MKDIKGYWNDDGKVGIRNSVAILPLSVFSGVAALNISNAVEGTVPLLHPHGRAEIGLNRERFHRNLVNQVLNPNVQSALLVGYEHKTTEKYLAEIRSKTKKRIESVVVLDKGTIESVAAGTKLAMDLSSAASEVTREPMSPADLCIGIKCGSTDGTSGIASNPAVGAAVDRVVSLGGTAIFSETTEIMGAEDVLSKRALNSEVAAKIMNAVKSNEEYALNLGVDLMGVNPVPDNIEGGISTIEEKSLGAILKSGTSVIQDVLPFGGIPNGKGLYFMDSPSAAQEVLTALTSAGSQLILFSTGLGNPSGTPISPVIKVTGNRYTVKRIPEHIDVDVSGMIFEDMQRSEAGDKIYEFMLKVINGKRTKAEILKHREFSPVPVGL
jgi:altronate dehydratase large subunit